MVTKVGSIKIVNFMTTGAGVVVLERGHISKIVEMLHLLKNFFLYSQA